MSLAGNIAVPTEERVSSAFSKVNTPMSTRQKSGVKLMRSQPKTWLNIKQVTFITLIFFMAVLLVLLSKIFWSIFAPLPAPDKAPVFPAPKSGQALSAETSLDAANPFMISSVVFAERQIALEEEITQTSLDLTLHGIRLDGDRSSAIIDVNIGNSNERGQDVFIIGDIIANGVSLVDLRFGEAIIERDGVREALRIEGYDPRRAAVQKLERSQQQLRQNTREAQVSGTVPPRDQSTVARIDELRNVIQPRLRGQNIFLAPGSDREAFASAGLVDGDRLISIDNQPVTRNLKRLSSALDRAGKGGQLNLQVERDGVTKNLTIRLDTQTLPDPDYEE